jgi:hypothetical protein
MCDVKNLTQEKKMYKKIIAYALICMSYHGAYVAIDFYDDSSSRGPCGSHMILQSLNDNNSPSYRNTPDTPSAFGNSNTAGFQNDPFTHTTNLNEAYHNQRERQQEEAIAPRPPSLAQRAQSNRFIKRLYDMQLAGDLPGLQQLASRLQTARKDCTNWFAGAKRKVLDWKIEQVEEVLADPVTARLHTIKTGDLMYAFDAFSEFPFTRFFAIDGVHLPSTKSVQISTTVPAGQTSWVMEPSAEFEEAKRLLRSRPDFQAYVKTHQEQKAQTLADGSRLLPIPPEVRSVRASMIEALAQSTQQVQLADTIDGVRCEIFDLAHHHAYEVHPEIKDQMHESIHVIRQTQHVPALIFHVAVVDHLLSDIQFQATPDAANRPTLLERSPTLLVHGLKKFVAGLNPITHITGLCEFLVDTARFACDVTAGKMYLSHEEYRARIDGFWQTMDALSPENLALLSAEDWVGLGATLAGGVVLGAGIYKTVIYLKEIEATSRVARQAATIASGLKAAIDTTLGQHPIAVTAGGMLLRMHDKIEEIEDKVVEVARNSGQLLQFAARAADGIAQRLTPLGLGPSRDARTIAENLHEQLVMEEIMANPLMGNLMDLKKGMTDPRWHKVDGWVKMFWYNHGIEVHYVAQWVNGMMKAVDDFKFKDAIKKVL